MNYSKPTFDNVWISNFNYIYIKVYKMNWETRKKVSIKKIFDSTVRRYRWYTNNSLAKLILIKCPRCHVRHTICNALKMVLNPFIFLPLRDGDALFSPWM